MYVNYLTNHAVMHVVGWSFIFRLFPVMLREAVKWRFKISGVNQGTFTVTGSSDAVDRIQFYFEDCRR